MKRFSLAIVSIVAVFSLLLINTLPVGAFPGSSNTLYEGIDVSLWQEEIDFSQVKNSGVEVVYIRAGEGSHMKDTYLEANYAGAKENGLKIGFYHYVTAQSVTQAEAQAEYFVSLIIDKDFDCRLAMDFESLGNLTKEEVNQISLAFMSKLVQVSGKEAVVYSDLSEARDIFDSRLSVYPLWIAEYGVSQPGDPGNWSEWVGFQYSDTGSVPGISGYVDLDKFTDGIFLTSSDMSPQSNATSSSTDISSTTNSSDTSSSSTDTSSAKDSSDTSSENNPQSGISSTAAFVGLVIVGVSLSLIVILAYIHKKKGNHN